jgi:asparagine synthase (glutamine-hydrolysing)
VNEEMLRVGYLQADQILVADDRVDEFRKSATELAHPWLRDVEGVPLAKLWQISTLFTEGFYDAHFRQHGDAPVVAPFLSQPLVELCLRIPTHWNAKRGRDRAVVRGAFAREMPDEILHRTGKGSPNGWLVAMIDRDRAFVREFLLDGLMVRHGVVDRFKLEQALPGEVSKVASHGGATMNLLYTEAWMRAWTAMPPPLTSDTSL